MKLWGGRFNEGIDPAVEKFTASISFDKRLAKYDVQGSIAHAKMLAKCGIISDEEGGGILKGLKEIGEEIERGDFKFDPQHEDVHLNIEQRLTEKIGELGGKLHTARSRNDQVALDIRMYLRDEIENLLELVKSLQSTIVKLAEDNIDCIMPGFTHLQHAQPILFSHHIMTYFFMLKRDRERLKDCLKRVNVMPLGAGALAGTSFSIDQEYVAKLLNFPAVTEHSIDAVSDRDFLVESLAAAALVMMHLSRLSEEIVLWSSREFGFVELNDSLSTGSSMMPQKKNPDVAELLRGKTGRVYGALVSLLVTMKALPLSYNSDMQEDKEPLFDAIDTVKDCLFIAEKILSGMEVKKERLKGALEGDYSVATDLADYLAIKGVPFREAHRIVGGIVRDCIKTKKNLLDLSLDELKKFSPEFAEDVMELTTPERSIARRGSRGGTSPQRVREMIAKAKKEV